MIKIQKILVKRQSMIQWLPSLYDRYTVKKLPTNKDVFCEANRETG
jgi:hypothetical protein